MNIDWTRLQTATGKLAAALRADRAGMTCSPLQGRLALGPVRCAQIDAIAADPATPWAMREAIRHAVQWNRTEQATDELGYVLGLDAAQMDALFRVAMTVTT